MGNKLSFCETRCQICAVAFRVNRIPTPHEREAWIVSNEAAEDVHDGSIHIAGAGYDGNLISAEEMKVCFYDMNFIGCTSADVSRVLTTSDVSF